MEQFSFGSEDSRTNVHVIHVTIDDQEAFLEWEYGQNVSSPVPVPVEKAKSLENYEQANRLFMMFA